MRSTHVPVSARDARDIAEAVRTVVWSLRRFGERQVGLPPLPHSEFEVIRTVSDHSDITVSDAARLLGLQPSNVSTTVRRLVEQGLVERVPDEHDRRSIRLRLTEKARGHKTMIDAAWVEAIGERLAQMTTEEAELLVEAAPLLRRLAAMA
ncbi:MarR family winged helix-turn-helix transcriptional regulator [Mycobacterium deserti]|uniref:MarR family transcriptional regulator n=1 Tax=Mycobacterium deserti TaxID=2978347 RepID=A0ABT2MGI6_9MYCO|nr:MarR family transcriptional regulator [Mycobacterium deserti]MCT7661398.1 MarR family transcriptional regulator [Mycobacterium deserti]